jgi:hypothetical protein
VHELAPGISLVCQLVDGLELSGTLFQTHRYADMPVDDLEALLSRLQAQRAVRWGPLPTPWAVQLDGADAPVHLLPSSPRAGWRHGLECPAWLLLVAADGAARPRFCIQLRASELMTQGPLAAWRSAREWVETTLMPLVGRLRTDEVEWHVSRVDLAADVTGPALQPSDVEHLTTRARNRERYELPATSHERGRVFSGASLGVRGSAAFARLYLKSFQASPDAPVRELWRQRGYDADQHHSDVWRVEFELRPSLLRELRVDGQALPTEPDALLTDHLDAVWTYLTTSWLTLRDRARVATRRERTPVAPWWAALAQLRGLNGGAPAAPGLKVSRDRSRRGDRDKLLKLALGAVAGAAALDGSADLRTALLALADFAREQGGDEAFATKTDKARARYGLPTLAAVRRRTLLPDALPVLADAA